MKRKYLAALTLSMTAVTLVSAAACGGRGDITSNTADAERTFTYWIHTADGTGGIVNSSRGIIFADRTENFAARAGEEARKLQRDMERLLAEHGIC